MEQNHRHFLVSGRVQGVFYRANTLDKAKELHLVGWVKNLVSGDVEVYAVGDKQSLDKFEKWLWQGPTKAKVEMVRKIISPYECYDDFVIR